MCKPLGAEFTLYAIMLRAGLVQAPAQTRYSKTYSRQESDSARRVLTNLLARRV